MSKSKKANPVVPIIAYILLELSKIADGFLFGLGLLYAFKVFIQLG